ncbi:hypothetical protein ACLG6S_00910 [Thermodesulfobacteriota bacterium B35]
MAYRINTPAWRSPTALWLTAAAILFLVCAWQHLHLGSILDSTLLFGDDGDGFFNLWVLQHNTIYAPRGPVSWMDGRIFWPDNAQTLFWSDILLVPTLPFAALRAMGVALFTSFNLTIILLSAATYATLLLLLHRFRQWSTASGGQARPDWFILLFSCSMVFSISQLTTYIHFQNLCGVGVLLILLGLCGFSATGKKRWLALALSAEVGLLYTAPYFAVLGSILFALWLLLHCLAFPERIRGEIAATWWLWLVAAAAALPPTLLYHRVPHLDYSPAMLHATMASHLDHLWTPSRGPLRQWLLSRGHDLPRISHESLAYMGIGVLFLLPFILALVLADRKRSTDTGASERRFLLPAGLYLLSRLTGTPLPAAAFILAWAALLLFLLLLLLHVRARIRRRPHTFAAFLVLLAAIAAFGLALGPDPLFIDARINPSIWGICKLLVPGVANMRAIGRMAGLANIFLLVWIYLQFVSLLRAPGRRRQWTALLVLLLLGLQNLEAWPVRARVNHYPAQRLQPDPEERAALASLPAGVGCVFPTNPWPRNTHAMLYLVSQGQITLINGYSARSTPLLDRLMAAGRQGREPTREQLAILEKTGCTYLLLWKRKIGRRSQQALAERYPLVAETRQMVILRFSGKAAGTITRKR